MSATPALPAGWAFADPATPVRSPADPVDARLPRAVTFDTDFSTEPVGNRYLLVAVVHSTPDLARDFHIPAVQQYDALNNG